MKKLKYKNLKDLIPYLPRHSYSVSDLPMEPISLIIIGDKQSVLTSFNKAGWYLADSINLLSVIKSAITTLLNSSYKNGPMWPAFVNNKRHQMGFEMPTKSDTYRRRHHLRLWKTRFRIGKRAVWVGTVSYDRSVGQFKNSFMPTHHISSTLNSEENFLARTFRIAEPWYVTLGASEKGFINTGDPYSWDGRALVIDLSNKKSGLL